MFPIAACGVPMSIAPEAAARERAARREKAVGDHLPYLAQVDDHTITTKDGLALQVIRLMHGASSGRQRGAFSARRNVTPFASSNVTACYGIF